MKHFFKKACSIALATLFAANFVPAGTVKAYNVGDIIGKVLSTDIITYVEGVQMPSFNINGRTAIVVQNLNALGTGLDFGISYDDLSRTLTIKDSDIYGTGNRGFFYFAGDISSKPVGTPVKDVQYTDIKTVFNGTELESFNIEGFTCIYADDLAKLCGTYIWDETARTVKVYRQSSYVPSLTKKLTYHMLPAKETVITSDEILNRWGEEATSFLCVNSDGTYTTVEISDSINIELYNSSFNHFSSFTVEKELPLFGGLYFGETYNYIAFGQENLMEDNSREVIRIGVYDKSFSKVRDISINNCKTAVPFDASSGEMYENDKYLVLHTSRSQYADENGNRPQTQLTVIIDKSTWQSVNMLGKFQHNHTSHALREFVKIDNGKIITANLSDAAPYRGIFLQELDFNGHPTHSQSLFTAGGNAGANCTGMMAGGLEISSSGYLIPISSIDHSLASGYSNVNISGIDKENRDIYLLWADKTTRESKMTCLARYTGASLCGSVPYIVKLPDDKFMVLWQKFHDNLNESDEFCYAVVDQNGVRIGATYTLSGKLSESCHPIYSNGNVIWYVNSEHGREFYSLSADISALTQQKAQTKVEETKPEKEIITEVEGI